MLSRRLNFSWKYYSLILKFSKCPVNWQFIGIIWYSFIFDIIFKTTFCASIWKEVHHSKEIVNLQGFFGLTVVYVNIKTYTHQQSITILLKGYILFIGCLYYLSVHFHSCYFYIQYHKCIGKITSLPVQTFCCFKLRSILLTWWRNIRLFYTILVLTIQEKSRFQPALPQSTICSYASAATLQYFTKFLAFCWYLGKQS